MTLDVLLFRQIHPKLVVNDRVSEQAFSITVDKQAFIPSTKDEGYLSVYNGATFTAEASYRHYTEILESSGVLAVSVEECENIELPCIPDDHPFIGHCSIDFNSKSKSERRKCATELRDKAVERGWQYLPEVG